MLKFTGERIVPEADNCEPTFANKMYQEHSARYFFASQLCVGKVVLDVGCGVGYGTKLLAGWGAAHVVGIDISKDAVQHAQTYYTHPSIRFEVGSATDWKGDIKFDLVTCFELIEHVADQGSVIKTIRDHLKPNGIVVMSTPRPLENVRSTFHERELNFYEFRDLLKASFRNARSFYQNNHFVSIVTDTQPKVLERIHAIAPQRELVGADYFVLVASDGEIPHDDRQLQTVMVMNDDNYVLTCEKDIRNLKNGENYLLSEVARLSVDLDAARHEVSTVETLRAEEANETLRAEKAEELLWVEKARLSEAESECRRVAGLAEEARREIEAAKLECASFVKAAVLDRDAAADKLRQSELHASVLSMETKDLRHDIRRLEKRRRELFDERAGIMRRLRGLTEHRPNGKLDVEHDEMAAAILKRESLTRRDRELVRIAVQQGAKITKSLSGNASPQYTNALRDFIVSADIFDDDDYRRRFPAVAQAGMDPLHHYVTFGRLEISDPHTLFDSTYYLSTYLDVLESGSEPLSHYVRIGTAEKRQPNPVFHTAWYLEHYPDVAQDGINPLAHYIRYGAAEGRWPNPFFDPKWYRASYNPDDPRPWGALAHYLEVGRFVGHRPNRYFDPIFYIAANPDVASSEHQAFAHYVECGATEGRAPSIEFDPSIYVIRYPTAAANQFGALYHYLHAGRAHGDVVYAHRPAVADRGRVVFIGSTRESAKKDDRIGRLAGLLCRVGFVCNEIDIEALPARLVDLGGADLVIFSNIGWSEIIERAIAVCRLSNVTPVFDADRILFDPAIANKLNVIELSAQSEEEINAFYDDVMSWHKLAIACDFGFGATDGIVDALTTIGLQSFRAPSLVLPNYRDPVMSAPSRVRPVIGWLASQEAAESDIEIALPVLANILANHDVGLRIAGLGSLKKLPELHPFSDRIVLDSDLELAAPADFYSMVDLIIAPKRVGNPCIEGEEAYVYFDAALAGKPVVASPTVPFTEAMVDGSTGYIAFDDMTWAAALKELLNHEQTRVEMGARAQRDVVEFHAPKREWQLEELITLLVAERRSGTRQDRTSLPESNIGVQRRPLVRRKLRIGWILPGLLIGGGGHRNILRAAYHLREFGHDVSLIFEHTKESAECLKELVREHFYPFDGPVFTYDETSRGEDVVFATHWSTVSSAFRLQPAPTEIMYFVQDFEPNFVAMGSDYLFAENTYRKDLYAITSGPWCERLLRRDFGMDADHFRFPIDRSIYFLRPEVERQNRVVFFAKPEMPRRCYEIGAEALKIFHNLNPDVEIVFFGSKEARARGVDYPVTYRDVLPGIADLAELYASARLGIAFSTTNPSLVPYEMMACGLPVLDLARDDNELNYGDRSDIAYLASPEPEVMARQIGKLLHDERDLAGRSQKGLEYVSSFPTEKEMARRVEELIFRRLMRRKC